jgi:hypothetical protein
MLNSQSASKICLRCGSPLTIGHQCFRNSLINSEVQTSISPEARPDPFQMCETHGAELTDKLKPSEAGLETRILKSCHALFTLAAQTIGTEGLAAHSCPICAFKNFDFISAIAEVVNGD